MLTDQESLTMIAKASRFASKKYFSLEFEDIYSTGVERWLKRRHRIKSKEEGGAPSALISMIVDQGCQQLLAEQSRHCGTQSAYTAKMVRVMLKSIAELSDITDLDVAMIRSDLFRCLKLLDKSALEIIWAYYVHEEMLTASEKRKLDRAVQALTKLMNLEKDEYVGSRKVRANSACMAEIRDQG